MVTSVSNLPKAVSLNNNPSSCSVPTMRLIEEMIVVADNHAM